MLGKATVNGGSLEDIRCIRPCSRGRNVALRVLRSSPKPAKRVVLCHRRGIETLSPDIIFFRCRLVCVIRSRVLPNRKTIQHLSPPGFSYRCHPPNTLRSERAQPPKRERLGFPANLRGARARRTRLQKGADCGPPPEENPPDEHWEFHVPAPKILRRSDISYRVPVWAIHHEGGRSASGKESKI